MLFLLTLISVAEVAGTSLPVPWELVGILFSESSPAMLLKVDVQYLKSQGYKTFSMSGWPLEVN
jgi:hypothetical protein